MNENFKNQTQLNYSWTKYCISLYTLESTYAALELVTEKEKQLQA